MERVTFLGGSKFGFLPRRLVVWVFVSLGLLIGFIFLVAKFKGSTDVVKIPKCDKGYKKGHRSEGEDDGNLALHLDSPSMKERPITPSLWGMRERRIPNLGDGFHCPKTAPIGEIRIPVSSS